MVLVTGHSTFAVTHEGMYAYLTANVTYLQQKQFGAGLVCVVRTPDIMEGVIKHWVNCSLTKECINPYGSSPRCRFMKDLSKSYAYCHRFDQSALNIILNKHFRGNVSLFYKRNTFLSVSRHPTHLYKLHTC